LLSDIIADGQYEGAGNGVRHWGTAEELEIENYWRSTVTRTPISIDLKKLVRADLIRSWHFQREARARDKSKMTWATIDGQGMVLDDGTGKADAHKLHQMRNKPTAFYWLQSAQQTDNTGQRVHTPGIIHATVYEEWLRCHDAKPDIEFGHFFANPERITSTGPSTIGGVLNAHHSLCTQASELIHQSDGRAGYIFGSHPYKSEHYSIFPLYHALIVPKNCLTDHNRGEIKFIRP
jgi:hypothetical protein